ncbi:acetate--CoA ligase family protein [Herbiconiux daphne]|uniref:Acetate--CoA ligase family protein n=1 Tax=Herbiconiux daphne TaxID=2970914 RepID=A0ABT2H3N3_9MICO|nr:acetate--CoA ligase family protein [Herbiconiux daphne]MCS5734549.1 acetate--CoA ligase family protein [Herbiconiux daphne]
MRDLTPLLAPRSIAIVGASSTLTALAGKPVAFLRDSGVDVAVYPVNPSRDEIGGYTAYPDPSALPEAPDVGLVLVPAQAVVAAVEALAKRGAKAAVVISSGFGEGDRAEGAAAQARMGEIAREHGMLLLGPNTLGVHDYVRGLPLSFVWYGRKASDPAGTVAVVSQSGSGMTSLSDRLLDAGLPLGYGIATGNEADVTVVDVLEHLAEDDRVKVIAAVFEEVRDGTRFIAVLRRLRELGKPLVALKVGRTESGSAMVKSHTGALAGSYPTLKALLRQYGVIEVTDLDQIPGMVAAALLGHLPTVDGIAVVTNSGGAAAIAADRADELGVPLAQLGELAQGKVRENLPAFAQDQAVGNPIDVTAQSMQRPFSMVDIVDALVEDPAVGGVVHAVPSSGGPAGGQWVDRLADTVHSSPKPVVSVILSGKESDGLRQRLRDRGVPVFSSPAAAVEALQLLRRFGRAVESAAQPAAPAEEREPIPLPATITENSTLQWLSEYGVPVARQLLAATPEAAAEAAEELGYPVAVKISSPQIAHKTEVGGVALGLGDAASVKAAAQQVLASAAAARPDAVLEGVTVSRMVTPVLELISGIHIDPTFGPVVLLGLGGIWAEVLGDVTMRGLPLGPDEAERMVDDLQGAPLLRGARGRTPVDPAALSALVDALARIAVEHDGELGGLDLNPVAVTAEGELVVLDAALFRTEV